MRRGCARCAGGAGSAPPPTSEATMPAATIELSGHIIDSMMLPRVLDAVMDLGGSFRIEELRVGTGKDDPSTARIQLQHDTDDGLQALVAACQAQGAMLVDARPARLEAAPRD